MLMMLARILIEITTIIILLYYNDIEYENIDVIKQGEYYSLAFW